jgi:Ca2+-transporting ATPase
VRSLPVVEILGGADLVCSDKTGTITEGRMSLGRLHTDGASFEVLDAPAGRGFFRAGAPADLRGSDALLAGGLCNNAHRRDDGAFLGDPTEVALLQGALQAGVELDGWDRIEELPFSSERKRMSVAVRRGGTCRVLAKGAPEEILARCTAALEGGQVVSPSRAGTASPRGVRSSSRISCSTVSPPWPIRRAPRLRRPCGRRPPPASGW